MFCFAEFELVSNKRCCLISKLTSASHVTHQYSESVLLSTAAFHVIVFLLVLTLFSVLGI